MVRGRARTLSLASAITIALLAVCGAGAASAGAQIEPYGYANQGQFSNILPPGANGLVDSAQLGDFLTTGVRPPHNDDQLAMYERLTTAAPAITAAQLGDYFKDATFGVPAGDLAKTETPEPGVSIEWDAGYGVPHIYGDTRAELMFGIGWATAEDRLFFIDALRHAGEGDLAQFAGGSNAAMDASVWATEPYTHQDLVNQVNWVATHLSGGAQLVTDTQNYVAGINAYIAQAENPMFTATMMPAEYSLLGISPKPFTVEDVAAIAALVGGIFGRGGGDQLQNAVLYEQLLARFGPEVRPMSGSPETAAAGAAGANARHAADDSGFATFMSFDDPNDPEAPTTVHGARFPYQTLPEPSAAVRRTIALPDPGSVRFVGHVVAGALPGAGQSAGSATAASVRSHALLAFGRGMSNALLISAAHSADGHPLAVMGPQTSYFAPQILMEEDIHGPGIDADGAGFAGVNMYVELGHGTDYAWSATSSGQSITDTFAVALCDPHGGRPAPDSSYYVLHGRCVAMQTLTDRESWTPNLADPTSAGSVTLRTQRTAFGLVIARATIAGRPVVYCNLRSTYMHELDSAAGFALFNEPAQMQTPQSFFAAASHIDYTFNWLYASDQHIAYFNSGANPVRAAHTDPLFPSWGTFSWPGYRASASLTPSSLVERDTPQSAHPQTIDPPYLTSWNNKQAPAYNDAATGQEFASVYRSQLLDAAIERALAAGHGKLSLADLVNAMGSAATQDLRGVAVLPYALAVIGHPRGPAALVRALTALRAWVASGAHRINREHPSASGDYDQTAAVRIMDAWWPLLVRAVFEPVLGPALLADVEHTFSTDDPPSSHLGSAFDVGFYGIVQKDLRSVLRLHVAGPLNRVFCGNGSLAACRTALESSLLRAAAQSAAQVYPAGNGCRAGDQMCADAIRFRTIGAISQPAIEWVNRPTFQQADDLTGTG